MRKSEKSVWKWLKRFYAWKGKGKVMRLFISKKKLVKKFAEELAYLQIRADWWYYVSQVKEEERQNMSSMQLDRVTELRCICHDLGIIEEVYKEAYKIYDFKNSGKKDFIPNIELIKKLDIEFCEPRQQKRPLL